MCHVPSEACVPLVHHRYSKDGPRSTSNSSAIQNVLDAVRMEPSTEPPPLLPQVYLGEVFIVFCNVKASPNTHTIFKEYHHKLRC
ncbi:hypothetical protein TNCV_4277661 [Trichonephila clavipes]|nr:hypothetical protein TNCV_4277661 [Trichonephila clavipes]